MEAIAIIQAKGGGFEITGDTVMNVACRVYSDGSLMD